MVKKQPDSAPALPVSDPDGRDVVAVLKRVHKPLRLDDFLRIFALPRRRKKNLEAELAALLEAGELLRLGGGAYCLSSGLKETSGTLHMQRSGIGFVLPDPPQKAEIFISPQHLGDAWHGDRVAVTLFPGQRGKSRDGRIARVLERAQKEPVVRAVRRLAGGEWLCEATDPHIRALFLTDASTLPQPPERDALLRIRPGERKGPQLWQARALACLGEETSAAVQEELTKANHAIPRAFPADALAEAAALPRDPGPADWNGRKDLTAIPFVTIDGDEAKDFDDAVHVEKKGASFLLRVAIADVAQYVRPGSALDAEAFSRGNSYYFPRSVEPMLPEDLSNNLCSLNPHAPRLVMAAEMTFDSQGNPGKESFYPAVIRSAARLTYDGVRDALNRGTPPPLPPAGRVPFDGGPEGSALRPPEAFPVPDELLPMLRTALELAGLLAERRRERGSLDFDLPEPRFLFGPGGEIAAVAARGNHFVHKLIEVFMVAANEAVARFLTARGEPLLYRSHPAPDPDKLRSLFSLLAISGLSGGGQPGQRQRIPAPKELQTALEKARGTPAEYLISRAALRAMMQAGYTQAPEGHFGLASDCYCHFTSPIRRYADLVVHRALKTALGAPDGGNAPGRKALQRIADHINETERTAMDAEREIHRRLSAVFMRDKVGEEFDGVISGLTEFGMFVELAGVMTEGMVRLGDLAGDYYVHYPERCELRGERSGRTFRLGQKLRVRVTDVNVARQEINLEPAGDAAPAARRGREGGNGPRGKGGRPGRGVRNGKKGTRRKA